MRATILDKKHEADSLCYLCKVPLLEYIRAVPTTYRDFDVQRGIVANRYLDRIAKTISQRAHIPALVLVSDELSFDGSHAQIDDFRILDGLQRTHRLLTLWRLIQFIYDGDRLSVLLDSASKFSRTYGAQIRGIGADTKLVKQLEGYLRPGGIDSAESFFADNYLWLEIWTGLSQPEQIEKMLLLNAGHKSVNIKHQLELLFLSTLFRLEDVAPGNVTFVREKDISSIQYSKTRVTGQYHFAHVISSLVALSAGRIVQTNTDFISDLQSDQNHLVELAEEFNIELIRIFIDFLYCLDFAVARRYHDVGTRWVGREVVLIGIFGAIGDFAEETETPRSEMLKSLKEKVDLWIPALRLDEFEHERNNVELNKVNVGNVNKRAVFGAFSDLLRGKRLGHWAQYFGGQQ